MTSRGGDVATVAREELAAGTEEPFAAIERAIEAASEGPAANVAVVGDPFAGREALLDHAERLLGADVERISFASLADDASAVQFPEAGAYVLDDCQYLYRREIDGFEVLDRLLRRVSMSDALFVTSWNRFAWSYLAAVRDVERSFPERIDLPALDADGIEAVVRERFGPELPAFVDTGAEGHIKSFDVGRTAVPLWGDRTLAVPMATPNPEYLRSVLSTETEQSEEAVVFEKLRLVSRGNPGVAAAVWEQSVTDGAIATGYVDPPSPDLTLDDDDAYLLAVLLSTGSVSRETLANVVGGHVDAAIQQFRELGLLTVTDGRLSLRPEGLYPAAEQLQGRRLLW